jgi:hypothetical protein
MYVLTNGLVQYNHLAKLISYLIVLSFKHENPQEGLDALSYSEMEKICYAVILSAHKLQHYIEAHTIRVLTNQLLIHIFGYRDSSRIISKWAVELSEHVVDFEKCTAIKSQILADFMAEWMEPSSSIKGVVPESSWIVNCDGAWGAVGAEAAAILTSPSGIKLRYVARL